MASVFNVDFDAPEFSCNATGGFSSNKVVGVELEGQNCAVPGQKVLSGHICGSFYASHMPQIQGFWPWKQVKKAVISGKFGVQDLYSPSVRD